MPQSHPHTTYTLVTTTGGHTVNASITVDEYGYWFLNGDELVLHVAHGFLHELTPTTNPVVDRATVAEKLAARGPQPA